MWPVGNRLSDLGRWRGAYARAYRLAPAEEASRSGLRRAPMRMACRAARGPGRAAALVTGNAGRVCQCRLNREPCRGTARMFMVGRPRVMGIVRTASVVKEPRASYIKGNVMSKLPTHCVDPNGITAEDLVAYAHGEARSAVVRHVAACAACGAEVRAAIRLDAVLQQRLFRRSCPPSVELGEYALDILAAGDRMRVASHMTDCPHCLAERDQFTSFLAVSESAPEPRPWGVVAAFRRLLATPLVPPASALAGLRGVGNTDSITYTAAGLRLTVSVQRANRGGHLVAGLVDDGDSSGSDMIARLYAEDRLIQTEPVDDLGNFIFDNLSPGSYRIEVTIPVAIVVIDPVDVR